MELYLEEQEERERQKEKVGTCNTSRVHAYMVHAHIPPNQWNKPQCDSAISQFVWQIHNGGHTIYYGI